VALPKDAANRTVNAGLLGHEDTWGLVVLPFPELLPPPTDGEVDGSGIDVDLVLLTA